MNWLIVFNNNYSGIIQSQVFDRLVYVQASANTRFRLVVFVSFQFYRAQRKLYKNRSTIPVTVFPLIGGMRFWWTVLPLLALFALIERPRKVIARSSFATNLAIWMRSLGLTSSVVFDARGAEAAEWREYLGRAGWPISYEGIQTIESKAIHESDLRIAVSAKLQDYWKEEYGYEATSKDLVIPCTVNPLFTSFPNASIQVKRTDLGFAHDDIVLVISASKSDWQSVGDLLEVLAGWLQREERLKLLILSNQELPETFKLEFSGRLQQLWLSPENVPEYYRIGDYGLLLREDSVTNRVAAPVKFAEYICSGLKVIISENIGDYSEVVERFELGHVLKSSTLVQFQRTEVAERERIQKIGREQFALERHGPELCELFA